MPLADQDRSSVGPRADQRRAGARPRCLRANLPGLYQIQAAINAVHADAAYIRSRPTGRSPRALRPAPTRSARPRRRAQPGRRRRRSARPAAALELIDDLALDRYQLYHSIRADLLRRLDAHDRGQDAYRAAIN